jgi:hypothetical protein
MRSVSSVEAQGRVIFFKMPQASLYPPTIHMNAYKGAMAEGSQVNCCQRVPVTRFCDGVRTPEMHEV